MDDKTTMKKQSLVDRVQESERAQEQDLRSGREEALKYKKKFDYLTTYRDANKQVKLMNFAQNHTYI